MKTHPCVFCGGQGERRKQDCSFCYGIGRIPDSVAIQRGRRLIEAYGELVTRDIQQYGFREGCIRNGLTPSTAALYGYEVKHND